MYRQCAVFACRRKTLVWSVVSRDVLAPFGHMGALWSIKSSLDSTQALSMSLFPHLLCLSELSKGTNVKIYQETENVIFCNILQEVALLLSFPWKSVVHFICLNVMCREMKLVANTKEATLNYVGQTPMRRSYVSLLKDSVIFFSSLSCKNTDIMCIER